MQSNKEIKLVVEGGTIDGTSMILAKALPPNGSSTVPHDVCCVVDVSGSMGSPAPSSTEDEETQGFSVLDIVKHAIRTIIHVLKPQDRLALVVFETRARVIFDFMNMDEDGKKKAENMLNGLYPMGGTFMWDGMKTGLELVRSTANKGSFKSIMLLTDGEPQDKDHDKQLQSYMELYKDLDFSLHTFGFGYKLKSALLDKLAEMGHGSYSFIPDSGFVGTIFVHSISNLLSTVGSNAQLQITPLQGVTLLNDGVFGYRPSGAVVPLGALQFGQAKEAVFKIHTSKQAKAPFVRVTLTWKDSNGEQQSDAAELTSIGEATDELVANYFRLSFVRDISKAMELVPTGLQASSKVITALAKEIEASPALGRSKQLAELLKDIQGQVTEAFSRADWYQKWGRHYLPSLARAHLLQICNNFKDFGVQVYGGELFQQTRDNAEEVFIKLPPPTPSLQKQYSNVSSSSNTQPSKRQPTDMSSYYNATGGCFAGECTVQLADGSLKQVKSVTKGDLLMTMSGKASQVVSVVKLRVEGITDLVELPGGLLLTPFHPILLNGKWQFPLSVGKLVQRSCDAVYDFVMSEEHNVLVNGYTCVTLGHDYQEDVVSHGYFGSQRIINDLQLISGWSDGLVSLPSGCFLRDSSNLIVGIAVNN